MDDLRKKLIESTVASLNEKFGDGACQTLSEAFAPEKVKGFIPTGNLAVDYVIGKPGIPVGRITEIAGRSGSGKSSLVAKIIGSAQAMGAIGVLIDAEHSYDSSWSRRFGVKPEELIYPEVPHLESVFDQTITIIKEVNKADSDIPIIIAIDSVSASPTAAELEQEDSTASKQAAEHAKIISLGLRKISNLIFDHNVALLFVSQLKDNPRGGYGDTKSKLGGHAIEFHSALMLELVRTAYLKPDPKQPPVGQTIQVKSVKNKFTLPQKVRTFDLYYHDGFRPKEILVDFLADKSIGLIKEKSGWYEFEGSKYRLCDIAEKIDEKLFEVVYDKLNIR
jgi:recombination protein RecA